MEAVHAAMGIDFDAESVARDRLRLTARLKGGGIGSMLDLRRPAFLGAMLNILPRCIDKEDEEGEKTKRVYGIPLTGVIREGAYEFSIPPSEGRGTLSWFHATRVTHGEIGCSL